MKHISSLFFAVVALSSGVAMAKAKMDVKPFLGDYNLVASGGNCSKTIKVVAACEGLKIMTVYEDGRTFDREALCEIDKGANRDISRGGGGHGIFPTLDFTKVIVKSNAEAKTITKLEKETSVSIGIFSSVSTTTVKMDTDNQLLIFDTLTTNASETESFCSYMRK